MNVLGRNFYNPFVKIKVIGVNTTSGEKISGGLAAVNCMLNESLPGVKCFAVDRHDTANLAACKAANKFRLLDRDDELNLSRQLSDSDLIFIAADDVWENIKLVALTAHCAKKIGVPVIFIAGGNFDDAENEIILDALIKLPSKNFDADACKVVENFVEAIALPGQPKLDINRLGELLSNSAAIVSYGERDGKNAVVKAIKAAIEHAENTADDFKATKKILFNVTASKANFSLEEAQKLSNLLKRHAPKAEIAFGFSIDDWLVDKVKILLIAEQ